MLRDWRILNKPEDAEKPEAWTLVMERRATEVGLEINEPRALE
jgi:hypothetical protein